VELNTSSVRPALVYSNADRDGNAGAFDPTDCPCEKLYEQIPPTWVLNPLTNKSGLEPTRFEEMSEDICYCATFRAVDGGLSVLRDAVTGAVPYGFQAESSIELNFTGSGSGGAGGNIAGLSWVSGSLSSADASGLVGRDENKYPQGWQLQTAGLDGAGSGIIPENISNHYLQSPLIEGYSSFNRDTKLLGGYFDYLEKWEPIWVPLFPTSLVGRLHYPPKPIYISNPSNSSPYRYKDCFPALSISSFQYAHNSGIYNVSLHECNSSAIAICRSGLYTPPPYKDTQWKLRVVSDGVEFSEIVINDQEYSDGDILPLSLPGNTSSWTNATLTASVRVNDGVSYISSLAYGSFISGSGASEVEGVHPAETFCGWASGLGGPEGISSPYDCQELSLGSCGGGAQMSLFPPTGETIPRGYPQNLVATTTVANSMAGGGIFVISGGSSLLADDYYPVDFGGNVDFIMRPSYCSNDPNTGLVGNLSKGADFLSSGGGIAGTITGAGYWFKKGEPFSVWLAMSGTEEWTSQRMGRVPNVHSKLPRFTQISMLGDPTGTMIGFLQYKSFGSEPPLPIAADRQVQFYEFRYQSPSGQSIGIPKEEGTLINFSNNRGFSPWSFSMTLTPVEDLLRARGSTETNTSLREAPFDVPPYPYMRYAPYVARQFSNEYLQTRGLLGGAPVDLAPLFPGDPITGGSFAGWSGLASIVPREGGVVDWLTDGYYASNGYSGYNDAYRGVQFLPYTASLSGCEKVHNVAETFWCTGETFSIFLSGELNLGTTTYIPGTTVLSSAGNITQTAAVVPQRGFELALPFHERADYRSFLGFESGALAGKILGAAHATSAGYHGSVYHVPVGLFLASYYLEDGACGTFPHYMLNWDSRAHQLDGPPWYHSETNLVPKISDALPANSSLITGISSYAEHFNFLQDISVASCRNAASTMASTTNPTLAVAVASFWAYDELTGGLNFPGFTSHNPSTPLREDAGFNYLPYYMPLWGAE
tara:strand:- start:1245 stop:4217 length:2973 start_codon:yes stop_codon:yes gene_type:complete